MVDEISGIAGAPGAIGPYSQVTRAQGLLFVSGQVPIVPETGSLIEGDIEAQAKQVMKNLSAVLTHFGLECRDICKTTILLKDLEHFGTVNAIYEQWLDGAKPARATFQVVRLPLDALIEIEMTVEDR
ncbi:Rid family detoxifying hydrolase [bacterium]|nr:Rid family detoxifying hydrolase [bacterium]